MPVNKKQGRRTSGRARAGTSVVFSVRAVVYPYPRVFTLHVYIQVYRYLGTLLKYPVEALGATTLHFSKTDPCSVPHLLPTEEACALSWAEIVEDANTGLCFVFCTYTTLY